MISLKKDFKSTSEKIFFAVMNEFPNLNIFYEPETIEVLPSKRGTLGLYRARQYTPDFLITYVDNHNILQRMFIETKGYARPADLIIMRLADIHYSRQPNTRFFTVTVEGTKKNRNRNLYLYQHRNIPKRGQKTISWLEYIMPTQFPNGETSRNFFENIWSKTLLKTHS